MEKQTIESDIKIEEIAVKVGKSGKPFAVINPAIDGLICFDEKITEFLKGKVGQKVPLLIEITEKNGNTYKNIISYKGTLGQEVKSLEKSVIALDALKALKNALNAL